MKAFLKPLPVLLFISFFLGCQLHALPGTDRVPERGTPKLSKIETSKLQAELSACIGKAKAETGIAFILPGQNGLFLHDSASYPMLSVYKFHQALAIAHYLDSLELPLSLLVSIHPQDLRPDTYSPLRDQLCPKGQALKQDTSLPIKALLLQSLQNSDNNACDILFGFLGNGDPQEGLRYADRYIQSLGLSDTRIAATEFQMHQDLQCCYQNRTSPSEAARLIGMLLEGKLFQNRKYQDFIIESMIECQTGQDRLAQPLLSTQARIGHKTGTGDRNSQGKIIGINDIGFVFLPDGRYYILAVFVKNSEESPEETTRLIARISGIVYQHVSGLEI